MNNWSGIGRLTKDVDLRYTGDQMAIARFTMAIDDGYGEKKKTNFIPVVIFGKTAENCDKYLSKGRTVGVTGKIQTGSYEKQDGTKVYTTEVVALTVFFIDGGKAKEQIDEAPKGFAQIDEDIPF